MLIKVNKRKKLIELYNNNDIIHPHNFEYININEAKVLVNTLRHAIKDLEEYLKNGE